jgi:hypothetical protein
MLQNESTTSQTTVTLTPELPSPVVILHLHAVCFIRNMTLFLNLFKLVLFA